MERVTISIAVGFLLACAKPGAGEDGQTTTTQTATETTDSGEPGDASSTADDQTDDPADSSETESDDDEGPGFVPPTDLYGCSVSPLSVCDEFAQDCPEGEKCVPYNFEDCTFPRCVPITGDKPAGEPCTFDESGDDCDADSWCYPGSLDAELPAICIGFCQGTADDSFCDDPLQTCVVDNLVYDGALGCRPSCDPLMPEGCEPFERCTFGADWQPGFGCVIAGGVADGEVCSIDQECDSGACVAAESLLECAGERCCAPWCDLMAPSCAMGLECVPVAIDHPNPNVGVCSLP